MNDKKQFDRRFLYQPVIKAVIESDAIWI